MVQDKLILPSLLDSLHVNNPKTTAIHLLINLNILRGNCVLILTEFSSGYTYVHTGWILEKLHMTQTVSEGNFARYRANVMLQQRMLHSALRASVQYTLALICPHK